MKKTSRTYSLTAPVLTIRMLDDSRYTARNCMMLGAVAAVFAAVSTAGAVTAIMQNGAPLQIFYLPMLGRAGPVVRMCDAANATYVYVNDMSSVATRYGAHGNTFTGPVINDGGFVISQSIAAAMHVGEKLGCPLSRSNH